MVQLGHSIDEKAISKGSLIFNLKSSLSGNMIKDLLHALKPIFPFIPWQHGFVAQYPALVDIQ